MKASGQYAVVVLWH